MSDDNRYTVSVSLKDDRARRAVAMPDGESLRVRVHGAVAAVKLSLEGGATLVERALSAAERDEGVVTISLESLQLDRWTTIAVVIVEAREALAAHHRSAAHEAPWKRLATIAVRGARARATLWLAALVGVMFVGLWLAVLPMAASMPRRIADIACAVLAAAVLLPLLGLGGRFAPRVALWLLLVAVTLSGVSWTNTQTVFRPPSVVGDEAEALPARFSRWLSGEVTFWGTSEVRVRGVRTTRGSRCSTRFFSWPTFAVGTERVALGSSEWVDVTAGSASVLGISREVECDELGRCCLRVRSERIHTQLALNDPTPSVRAELAVEPGPALDATRDGLLNAPMLLRLQGRRGLESVTLRHDAMPNLSMEFSLTARDSALLLPQLGRGWRGSARWSSHEISRFECAPGASRLTDFTVVQGSVARIEGRGWAADLSRSSHAVVCSFANWNEANDAVTLVIGEPRRTGGSSITELWAHNASSFPSDWSSIRMVRRDGDQREVVLSETMRPEGSATGTTLVAVSLASSLQHAQLVELVAPGRKIPLWRRREGSAPVVLLNVPSRAPAVGQRLNRFSVTVRDGGSTRVATATIVLGPQGQTLEEIAETTAPECCRFRGELAYCDEAAPMLRLPPRRVLLPDVHVEGCGAVFELQTSAVIRDPVRR